MQAARHPETVHLRDFERGPTVSRSGLPHKKVLTSDPEITSYPRCVSPYEIANTSDTFWTRVTLSVLAVIVVGLAYLVGC